MTVVKSLAMPKAIVVEQIGGPEQLRWQDVPEPVPGPGQALVRHTAIGVNFIDVYFRTGVYKAASVAVRARAGRGGDRRGDRP